MANSRAEVLASIVKETKQAIDAMNAIVKQVEELAGVPFIDVQLREKVTARNECQKEKVAIENTPVIKQIYMDLKERIANAKVDLASSLKDVKSELATLPKNSGNKERRTILEEQLRELTKSLNELPKTETKRIFDEKKGVPELEKLNQYEETTQILDKTYDSLIQQKKDLLDSKKNIPLVGMLQQHSQLLDKVNLLQAAQKSLKEMYGTIEANAKNMEQVKVSLPIKLQAALTTENKNSIANSAAKAVIYTIHLDDEFDKGKNKFDTMLVGVQAVTGDLSNLVKQEQTHRIEIASQHSQKELSKETSVSDSQCLANKEILSGKTVSAGGLSAYQKVRNLASTKENEQVNTNTSRGLKI
jgi:hypothetical protein